MASLEDDNLASQKEAEIKESNNSELATLRAMQEAELAELRGESVSSMADDSLVSVRKRLEDEKASRVAELKRRSELEK